MTTPSQRPSFSKSIELFGTTWELGQGAKDRTKSAANLAGSCVIVQLSCPDSGWRRFGHYADWDACRRGTAVLQGDRRHLFEIVQHNKPCKPYLDIDCKADELPACCTDAHALVAHLEALVLRVFKEDYLVDLQLDHLHWLHSPNPAKISLHLVISTHAPQLVFRSNHVTDPKGAAHLAKRLVELDPECAGKVVDLNVYTKDREFRVCGACKYGRNDLLRPLARALTAEELIAEPPLAPDDSLITSLDSDVQLIDVPEHVPAFVRAKVRKPTKITHITDVPEDAPFVLSRMLEMLRDRLHPTAYSRSPHVAIDAETGFQSARFSYTDRTEACYTGAVHEGKQNLSCSVGSAGEVYARCFSSKCSEEPPLRLGPLHQEPDVQDDGAVVIDSPFLSALGDGHIAQDPALERVLLDWLGEKTGAAAPPCVSIRSPMGTGKTTLLDNVMRRLGPEATALVITYRQTLALEQTGKLKTHGFVSYLDVPHDKPLHRRAKYPRVICQLESMHRLVALTGEHETFDLVIVDESESVLRHINSPTVKAPAYAVDLLLGVLRGARRVITLDAFWGNATADFLSAGGITNRLVINKHKAPPRTFEFTNHNEAWRARILDDLSEGRNVVVASLSTEMLYKIRDRAIAVDAVTAEETMMHTSKTGDEVKKKLVDVNGLWTKYRFVLYSPTISAGVDFSAEHFDRMYLYVCPMSCVPLGALQMSGRVRNLRDSTIVCCTSPNMRLKGTPRSRRVTVAEATEFIRWMDDTLREKHHGPAALVRSRVLRSESGGEDIGEVFKLPERTALLQLQALDRAERLNASARFVFEFRDLAEPGGHNVVIAADMSGTSIAVDEEVLQAASEPAPAEGEPDGMTTTIRSILAAPDHHESSALFQELQGRIMGNEATEEDKWADFKHRYKTGWGVDRVDEAFLRRNGVRPTCPEAHLLTRVLYPPLCESLGADATVAARAAVLKASLVREVIAALGFASPFDTELEIKDIMAVWERALKDTEMFKKYASTAKLFTSAGRTTEWDANAISKALGMVLGSVGLALDSKSKRVQRKGVKSKTTIYRLDAVKAERMLELVRLKMRGSGYRGATPNAHARDLLLLDEYPMYGHLVDAGVGEAASRLKAFAFIL